MAYEYVVREPFHHPTTGKLLDYGTELVGDDVAMVESDQERVRRCTRRSAIRTDHAPAASEADAPHQTSDARRGPVRSASVS